MSNMFSDCTLPEGFTLGNKFDTSKVTDMKRMFSSCGLPKGFTLGHKFDTSKVTDMRCMFSCCTLPEGLILDNRFDTSSTADVIDVLTTEFVDFYKATGRYYDEYLEKAVRYYKSSPAVNLTRDCDL